MFAVGNTDPCSSYLPSDYLKNKKQLCKQKTKIQNKQQ